MYMKIELEKLNSQAQDATRKSIVCLGQRMGEKKSMRIWSLGDGPEADVKSKCTQTVWHRIHKVKNKMGPGNQQREPWSCLEGIFWQLWHVRFQQKAQPLLKVKFNKKIPLTGGNEAQCGSIRRNKMVWRFLIVPEEERASQKRICLRIFYNQRKRWVLKWIKTHKFWEVQTKQIYTQMHCGESSKIFLKREKQLDIAKYLKKEQEFSWQETSQQLNWVQKTME